ncbi:MAG: hypothetical protein ABI729_04215 [Chitinophagales bacterium]
MGIDTPAEWWTSHNGTVAVCGQDAVPEFYTAEQEREDALFFESQPYNVFAAADEEAHYLFRAGFTSYCSCSRCEQAGEASVEAAEDEYHYLAGFACHPTPLAALLADQLDSAHAAAIYEDTYLHLAAEDPWNLPPF